MLFTNRMHPREQTGPVRNRREPVLIFPGPTPHELMYHINKLTFQDFRLLPNFEAFPLGSPAVRVVLPDLV